MVQVRMDCDHKTCFGSSRNDPAYDEMNKRIDEGELVFGGYICNCRCHESAKAKKEILRLEVKI